MTICWLALFCVFAVGWTNKLSVSDLKEGFWAPVLLTGLLLIGMGYFLVFKLLLPMVGGKAALELSAGGLRDNVRAVLVPWDNISGFYLNSTRGNSFVTVELVDKLDFLSKSTSVLQTWSYKFRQRMTGSPFVILCAFLKGRDTVILGTLDGYREEMAELKNAGNFPS